MKFNLSEFLSLLLVSLLVGSCSSASTKTDEENKPFTLAFGSCNRQLLDQPLWKPIISENPDVWAWLGDNIYADTHDMQEMAAGYSIQFNQPGYQELRQSTRVAGIWDDHDYGINDGGKYYSQKDSSQQLLLDFLEEPASSPRRAQKGAYTVHTFASEGKQVKLFLLDTRYHRDTLSKENGQYVPNQKGTILGDAQWKWLEEALENSDAAINLIASSIQVIPEEHRFEKWANFPQERKRLLDLIQKTHPKGTVLLSGDRHISEISRMTLENGDPLYEITSSGLTHAYTAYSGEPNRYRIGKVIHQLHYGLLQINWQKQIMNFQIKGEDGEPLLKQEIPF
ncbi:alkaline phosphatase D family protein [Cyclobacterium jeungdonense]|uniref:Alkaline phosphatase D family protein n=1 Tax=Cyclobacterium jeungdonense TaxID=708087 RepID=A0ABT8CFN9_9BACT|nr:alkaline phosphatase D family protein [Cyclobacterium jeungdonense]MDN3690764.1 alkaline phosphatase D family protein [Cyclobacterium jeungdonense]